MVGQKEGQLLGQSGVAQGVPTGKAVENNRVDDPFKVAAGGGKITDLLCKGKTAGIKVVIKGAQACGELVVSEKFLKTQGSQVDHPAGKLTGERLNADCRAGNVEVDLRQAA